MDPDEVWVSCVAQGSIAVGANGSWRCYPDNARRTHLFMWDLEAVGAGSSIGRVICVPSGSVKICGNPDESRWNSLDPSGCSLAKVAGAEALAR